MKGEHGPHPGARGRASARPRAVTTPASLPIHVRGVLPEIADGGVEVVEALSKILLVGVRAVGQDVRIHARMDAARLRGPAELGHEADVREDVRGGGDAEAGVAPSRERAAGTDVAVVRLESRRHEVTDVVVVVEIGIDL